jgi:hypothetical protein
MIEATLKQIKFGLMPFCDFLASITRAAALPIKAKET